MKTPFLCVALGLLGVGCGAVDDLEVDDGEIAPAIVDEKSDGVRCSVTKAKLVTAIKAFVRSEKLFSLAPPAGITSTWKIRKTVAKAGVCLAAFQPEMSFIGGHVWDEGALHAFAFKKSGSKIVVSRLSDALALPAKLRTAIGAAEPHPIHSPDELHDSFYYAEFSGPSVAEIAGSVLLEMPVLGFSAKLSTNRRKLAFDPTPARTWRVSSPKYSLSRGLTAEVLDVQPFQLDEDFEGYYTGSGGAVASWGYAYVRRVSVGTVDGRDDWREVLRWNRAENRAEALDPLTPVLRN